MMNKGNQPLFVFYEVKRGKISPFPTQIYLGVELDLIVRSRLWFDSDDYSKIVILLKHIFSFSGNDDFDYDSDYDIVLIMIVIILIVILFLMNLTVVIISIAILFLTVVRMILHLSIKWLLLRYS